MKLEENLHSSNCDYCNRFTLVNHSEHGDVMCYCCYVDECTEEFHREEQLAK